LEIIDYMDEQDYIDDLDLMELITSDSSTTNKYLVFEGSNQEVYGINVAKVIEILVYKNLNMIKNGKKENLVRATAKIRDEIATVINFDEWMGNEVLEDDAYEFVILVGFGGYNMALMVNGVDHIVSIDSKDMKDNSINNPKTNFITTIKIKAQDRLCTIFDCDRMLLDIFEDIKKKNDIEKLHIDEDVSSDKLILLADDSRFIRKMIENLLDKLGFRYEMFENGKDLFDRLKECDADDIALVVTDLEMPIMDGVTLIKSINELQGYEAINIVVNTNMSKFVVESSLIQIGVDEVIGKIDMERLSKVITKYLSR
jgi:two-component system chemotaxis response regulator CheV